MLSSYKIEMGTINWFNVAGNWSASTDMVHSDLSPVQWVPSSLHEEAKVDLDVREYGPSWAVHVEVKVRYLLPSKWWSAKNKPFDVMGNIIFPYIVGALQMIGYNSWGALKTVDWSSSSQLVVESKHVTLSEHLGGSGTFGSTKAMVSCKCCRILTNMCVWWPSFRLKK